MYAGDHNPPHVYVLLRDGSEALVEIATGTVIGGVTSHRLRQAQAWIAANQAHLMQDWKQWNP